MNKFIDLHTHSTASDGTMTPSELAKHAHENNLSAIALTDHDTTDGISEFISACEKYKIEPVAGVEISTKYKSELHIVGIFIDFKNAEFNKKLQEIQNSRSIRNKEILNLLQNDGFGITEQDILSSKLGATLENTGRVHIANIMTAKGYVKDTQEAFDKYLKKGAKYYVSRKICTPDEAVRLIKSAGGLAILAHPIFITKNDDELRTLLIRLKNAGLDAMECWYSEHTAEYRDYCIKLCNEFDLLVSGGSDFHGENKAHVKLGKVCDNMNIPYSLLEKMKELKGKC